MRKYSFDDQDSEARAYERAHKITLARLSDWNTRPQDISVPLGMYGEAFGRSLNSLTRYPETSRTKELSDRLAAILNKHRGIQVQSLYLYGSATQAINMLFFALAKKQPNGKYIFISPGYFSVESSAKALGLSQITLHRKAGDKFAIPLSEIEHVRALHEHESQGKVCAVMITEPVYSAGIRQSTDSLRALVNYCQAHSLLLIIDGSFSGLVWNAEPHWQDKDLLNLLRYNNVALVDSISKKLFFLNTKIGLLYGPRWLIQLATEGADWLTGNITALQQQLANSVFEATYHADLAHTCRENIDRFERRFAKLENLAKGSHYIAMRPDSGYHVMLFRDEGTIDSVDSMAWSARLLEKGVYAIPGHDFGYAPTDPFCFRVSLALDHEEKDIRSAIEEPIS